MQQQQRRRLSGHRWGSRSLLLVVGTAIAVVLTGVTGSLPASAATGRTPASTIGLANLPVPSVSSVTTAVANAKTLQTPDGTSTLTDDVLNSLANLTGPATVAQLAGQDPAVVSTFSNRDTVAALAHWASAAKSNELDRVQVSAELAGLGLTPLAPAQATPACCFGFILKAVAALVVLTVAAIATGFVCAAGGPAVCVAAVIGVFALGGSFLSFIMNSAKSAAGANIEFLPSAQSSADLQNTTPWLLTTAGGLQTSTSWTACYSYYESTYNSTRTRYGCAPNGENGTYLGTADGLQVYRIDSISPYGIGACNLAYNATAIADVNPNVEASDVEAEVKQENNGAGNYYCTRY